MKKLFILIALSILASFTSCIVKKTIETKVVCDQVKSSKAYKDCMEYATRGSKIDSATTAYYDRECKRDASRVACKSKKFIVYRKHGAIIKEIEITE